MPGKPRYLEAEQAGRERWLISYADVITVLLILFVAMAAESPGKQATRLADPLAPALPTPPNSASTQPGVLVPAASPESHEKLIQAARRLEQRGLDLRLSPRGLLITLPQAILFASGEDRINPSALPIVSEIAGVLGESDNRIELAGHADTIPIHNRRFKNNWELSAARSLGLLNLLVTRYGIEERRISVSSYGPYNPKSSNDTAGGRAENRRVEILIVDEPEAVALTK